MEYLLILTGMNFDNEIEEVKSILVTADNKQNANKKAESFLGTLDDNLCWDIHQSINLLDEIERIS